jgi:hypothetical protein
LRLLRFFCGCSRFLQRLMRMDADGSPSVELKHD